MTAASARRPLPVGQTVTDAFTFVLTHWWPLLRISWIWLIASYAALAWYLYTVVSMVSAAQPGDMVAPPVSSVVTAFVVLLAVGLLGLSSTAVGQHRLLLLGEQPPAIYLRADRLVGRYLLRIVVICLIVLSIFVPAMVVMATFALSVARMAPDSLAIQILSFIAFLPALLVACRLGISLPGISVGQPLTLIEALVVSKGNTLHLCAGWLLTLAPSYALSIVAPLPVGPELFAPWMLLYLLASLVVSTVCAFATISFFSLSYRLLVGPPQPVQAQPSP